MVMKRNAMRRNLRQSIVKSFGRYIAIVAIIALGAALFIGLLMTKADMVKTGQQFMNNQNMFDLRLTNSYGWTEDYLDKISRIEGVEDIEAVTYLDLIARIGDTEEDSVYRFLEIPETLNLVALRGGRLPERDDECLADGFHFDDSILGKTVTVSESNDEESLECVAYKTFTVVGYVATPLYMDMNRGTTSVGSGSLASFFYIPAGVLDMDYVPEINITIPGDYAIYTDKYNDALEAAADTMEPQLQILADKRLEEVREEALDAYREGLAEYTDGLMEYAEGKSEADKELSDAYQELLDGEQELIDSEQQLKDGEQQIADARLALAQGEKSLQQSKQTLANSKAAAYKQISESTQSLMQEFQSLSEELDFVDADTMELSTQILALDAQISPLETELSLVESQISQTQSMISILDTSINAARSSLEMAEQGGETDEAELEEMRQEIADLEVKLEEYYAQLEEQEAQRDEINAQLAPLYEEKSELEDEQAKLEAKAQGLEDSISSITESLMELVVTQSVMDNEFAAADAQIESAEAQIEAGYLELDIQEQTIADGWIQLEEGKQKLEDGWKEYEEGKAEAEAELADALLEIQDGAAELADAWEMIQDMTENEIIILDRNSNVGYNNLDSSSNIVAGVARVLPVFFLLVASLVCITTMTRMIDEERTQIGTLKALGYTNREIISKYMIYSGSGALLGCGLGILAGSTIFPMIIWQAYCIMLYIQPNMVLTVNWMLCAAVVLVYTAVLLFVTWYCCHRTLEEEPAELIRPKSPDAGKKILMEYLPFWHKISFLNKVTIRNIFRYRQRLAMMMVGIGGCTALLLTGFGLRDSIVNVVDYQFEEVSHYDMEVYFREGITEEERRDFLKEVKSSAEGVMFYHQSSVELEFDGRVKEIYMISGDSQLANFMDLHEDDTPIPLPGEDEVVLSVGVAEAMGIGVGDQVVMRSADMESLNLTVSGIYDNHVYNYSIVSPGTIYNQWNRTPEQQMAFVTVQDGQDVHTVGAEIMELSNVMNVSISDDVAEMVGGMMDALDLVVWVIVFCAGLLAVIVLYNLTNININERIREIATIKVLGFNASETAAYVFKENLSLTVAGSGFGLLLGYLLLLFVMSQIKIDMVWFKALIEPVSYVWSIVLTLLSAVVVDFIFYFKLEKINMAEALKSVE